MKHIIISFLKPLRTTQKYIALRLSPWALYWIAFALRIFLSHPEMHQYMAAGEVEILKEIEATLRAAEQAQRFVTLQTNDKIQMWYDRQVDINIKGYKDLESRLNE